MNPPPQHMFVPSALYPDITKLCKSLSDEWGIPAIEVSVVSPSFSISFQGLLTDKQVRDKNKKGPLGRYVSREGWHFDEDIVEEACDQLDYIIRNGKYVKVPRNLDILTESLEKYGPIHDPTRESNEQIQAAIRDLFPNIPEQNAVDIARDAWQEGKNRVGNATDLSLAKRVQLAVCAHIRHTFTPYDQLLKSMERRLARGQVNKQVGEKLAEWRGDERLGDLVACWREVIVIDDSDDEDDDDHDDVYGHDSGESRGSSLEVEWTVKAGAELRVDDTDYQPPYMLYRLYPIFANHFKPSVPAPSVAVPFGPVRPVVPSDFVEVKEEDIPVPSVEQRGYPVVIDLTQD